MFEEICLICGKALQDDGRAYCGEECQNSDLVSPSISSSSSALSSPSLGFAQAGEVPPLAPSALGSALRKFQGRDSCYISSSSASSNSWSLATDDDDGVPAFGSARGCGYRDGADSIYDGSSKSANFIYSMMPSALSYTRRPSGINTHSTIPQVHQRSPSGDSPIPASHRSRVRGAPRSVPNPSNSSSATDEDEDFSDFSLDNYSEDYSLKPSSRHGTRDRGSLPAYFNPLQIKSPSKQASKTSPILSSSGNTVARPSPPTPKTPLSSRIPEQSYDPPRGRRRNAEESRCSRRSERSSPSRSLSRNVYAGSPRASRLDATGSGDPAFDLLNAGLTRGRASIRKSSSPPPRMLVGVGNPPRVFAAPLDVEITERSQSSSNSRTRGRGRVTVQELEGVGCLALAPGFGNGRSGLLDRGRVVTSSKRVPL